MIPAPAYFTTPAGKRAHRVRSWRYRPLTGRIHEVGQLVARCGEPTDWFGYWATSEVTDHPTMPVCRRCVPIARRER